MVRRWILSRWLESHCHVLAVDENVGSIGILQHQYAHLYTSLGIACSLWRQLMHNLQIQQIERKANAVVPNESSVSVHSEICWSSLLKKLISWYS